MDIDKQIEELMLQDCPLCEGPSLMEEEGGGFYVMCADCGAHTPHIDYGKQNDRLLAAKKAAELWNFGKVLGPGPGE